jgi:hypothetical protein
MNLSALTRILAPWGTALAIASVRHPPMHTELPASTAPGGEAGQWANALRVTLSSPLQKRNVQFRGARFPASIIFPVTRERQ